MATVKGFLSHGDQVARLASRGMDVGDTAAAAAMLQKVSYYRLSGYWYPFRQLEDVTRLDRFYPGTTLADVVRLYEFDSRLRAATFAALAPVELAVRAALGHELGRINECAHLRPNVLAARARQGHEYSDWLAGYNEEIHRSREDFVHHHLANYGGVLPVWAAVEILDWGALTRLFGFSPRQVQDTVAAEFGLRAPQMESWLKTLNIVRNISAHHGRLFNRVFVLAPKLPTIGRYPDLDACGAFTRTFGQLSLIQHMLRERQIGNQRLLPAVLRSYPAVGAVPLGHVGAPSDWQDLALWSPA